jgi:predicted RNA-binding protein with PUA-like domain
MTPGLIPTSSSRTPGSIRSVSRRFAQAGLESFAMNWLFKEEPEHYSYDDLVRDGRTSWTGVRNPVAQRNLRSVKKGDKIFFYHTGNEKAVIGICRAAGDAYADPADKSGKLFAVDVEPVKKLKSPVTLAAIKADRKFATFVLTRVPRLSVMPVSDEEWKAIVAMGG